MNCFDRVFCNLFFIIGIKYIFVIFSLFLVYSYSYGERKGEEKEILTSDLIEIHRLIVDAGSIFNFDGGRSVFVGGGYLWKFLPFDIRFTMDYGGYSYFRFPEKIREELSSDEGEGTDDELSDEKSEALKEISRQKITQTIVEIGFMSYYSFYLIERAKIKSRLGVSYGSMNVNKSLGYNSVALSLEEGLSVLVSENPYCRKNCLYLDTLFHLRIGEASKNDFTKGEGRFPYMIVGMKVSLSFMF